VFGILANVIAVPISAMWTLPWGLVSCLLMPFGLERLGLVPMGWGIAATVWTGQSVAGLPGNVWATPHLPMYGLMLIALGGLWLGLWHGRWRVWGLAGIAAGLATMLLTRPPDLVLADFGRLLAARAADGNYYVAAGSEKLTRSFLMRETAAGLRSWPEVGTGEEGLLECPGEGRCFYTSGAPPGRAGHERGRAADRVRHGRCDRRSGARRVRLPVADPDRGPDRQLA
jgi:competence protein ComEC